MKQLFIPGGNGCHGKDLVKRDLFQGFQNPIIVRSNQQLLLPGNHAIIVPIRATSQLIENVLNFGGETQIVNFAGVMGTNPEGSDDVVANIHCLFGPGAIGDLNAIITKNKNYFSRKIEENLKKSGIKVFELTHEEHDKKMAVIQAFTHFCEILLGIFFKEREGVKELLSKWQTNEEVIEDMINLNKYFKDIIYKIFEKIKEENDLSSIFIEIVLDNLENGDIENLSTPNFRRVFEFFIHNNGFVIDKNSFYVDNIKKMVYKARK